MARDYRGREDECVEEIVKGDKEDIDGSKIVLAFCPKPSVGTAMEIFYAWQRPTQKVVVYVPEGAPVSPWLRYHCDELVHTAEDAVAAINRLL